MLQKMKSLAGCVGEGLGLDDDAKHRLRGTLEHWSAKVQERIECAQERIDSSLESIKLEHERFVSTCHASTDTCFSAGRV